MSVKETSIKSYMQLKDTGDLTDQQRQVLQLFINEMPCTRNEVAEKHGWKNGTIAGRTRELEDKDFLTCIGKRQDEYSGRTSEVFTVNQEKVLDSNQPLFVDDNKKQEDDEERHTSEEVSDDEADLSTDTNGDSKNLEAGDVIFG